MSTTSSFAGMAIKLKEEHQNKESLIEIAKQLGYSEHEIKGIEEEYYDTLDNNRWCIKSDYNGVKGLVYPIENEYEAFDINTKLTLEQINTILGEVLNMVESTYIDKASSGVSVFSILYYNGSDNPFTF